MKTKKRMTMKRFLKVVLIILAVIVALMVLISNIPAIGDAVPSAVKNFADTWVNVGVAALLLIFGILVFSSLPVVGIAFIIVGVIMIYTNLKSRRSE